MTQCSYRHITGYILLLVLLDQVIKWVINIYFLESHFNIIPGLLEFHPTFNNKNSYIGSLLYKNYNLTIGFVIHLMIILPAECLIISFSPEQVSKDPLVGHCCCFSDFRNYMLVDWQLSYQWRIGLYLLKTSFCLRS